MEKHEILAALKEGKTVHWSNSGYVVYQQDNALFSKFTRNNNCCGLQPNEYEDCFIAKEAY